MTAPLLDPADPRHDHAAARLAAEAIAWLTTVDDDARPHSVPVWFLFTDPEILLFSRPDTRKIARIRTRPGVCLSLDTAVSGTDVVLADGDAALSGEPAPAELRAFGEKYRDMLGDQDLAGWRQVFAQPVRVRLHRIVAWHAGPDGLERAVARPR
ncbi:PPOX class probable F420-dependent enzyme, Rv3369 family [Pseudonocardia ammonioxydans]|uniref:PPOX class probable F420-dependent enzyme, Rv3369 family n=1 Tax=Pseudonocardia ammonioxydans TaxID=260086 RepID=A0A1I5C377_PSUAM|nr:pyridoxamine 5'-phosphate oxidase family protein [Pseudonocardia ammonioxydans]SFN81445.1 PPOX class probable F420-dependent enzyme, Rv3369 family [Pseudonocardia ammonioxydans]